MKCAKNQVACEGGMDGDLRGLVVADLTDHYHIRVLTQERTQSDGKSQSGFHVNLRLADPLYLVFYRVLHSNDILPDIVYPGNGSV